MGLEAGWLAIDTQDPEALASFWIAALDWRGSTEPQADDDVEIVVPADCTDAIRRLLFLHVPEAKQLKNRLHLDLRPDNQAVELERLLALGATRVEIG